MNIIKRSLFLLCTLGALNQIFADNLISDKKIVKCNYSESNVNTVIKFENAVLSYLTGNGNLGEIKKYISTSYKQHYPLAEDGVTGLMTYLTDLRTSQAFNNTKIETYRVFGCGDYVTLENIFYTPKNKLGTAAINTFMVKDNKIVEHWEVVQPIPEHPKNKNGVF